MTMVNSGTVDRMIWWKGTDTRALFENPLAVVSFLQIGVNIQRDIGHGDVDGKEERKCNQYEVLVACEFG
jgi:hypothetical protein